MNSPEKSSTTRSDITNTVDVLLDQSLPETHREVLQRIATQRERIAARRNARVQALALRSQHAGMPAGAPLPERLLAFVRLHPLAVAGAAGLALVIGPGRLIRWSGIVLPLLAKFRR